MRKKIILVIIAFLYFDHCTINNGQNDRKIAQFEKEIKFNFAKSGLYLREKPAINSKILSLIPYGSELLSLNEIEPQIKIDNLKGKWTEVEWNNKVGFVFGGYLLTKEDFHSFNTARNYIKNQIKTLSSSKKFADNFSARDTSEWSFFESKANSKYKIYTFRLYKVNGEEDTCSYYGYSNCINVILNLENNIIYTDINYEPIGNLYYIDETIAIFMIAAGDGDECNSYSMKRLHIYDFAKTKMIKFIKYENGHCELRCDTSSANKGCFKGKWKQKSEENFFDTKGNKIIPTDIVRNYLIRAGLE